MAFQGTINRFCTFGIQGDLANGQAPRYTALTPRVATGETIYAGDFVWVKETSDGSGVFEAKKANQLSNGKPTGIVQRVMDIPLPTAEGATLQIPAGRKCDVVVFGDVFVKVSNTASVAVGQKLYVDKDGVITCGAAGDSSSSLVETDWTIVSLAGNAPSATGSVVIASNVNK